MTNKTIYLVNAGNDAKYRKGVVHGCGFPPLSVVSLGTVVEQYTDWHVKVFDGHGTEESEIIAAIEQDKPRVAGVSVLSTSYQSALAIANAAKRAGAITIFGNDQAAITGRAMLRSRPSIDYICTADVGEPSLLEFLEFMDGKRSVEQVSSLLYRKGNEIVENSHHVDLGNRFTYLDQIPIPNRSLVPQSVLQKYLDGYRAQYPDEGVTGTATINRFRGCARVKDPCAYCGIADLTIRASSPTVFWDDVRAAHELGANRLFEAGDSVSSVPSYLEQLVAAKPKGLSWDAFVYTSARETTPKLVELYRSLGVFRANMGLDSGDDAMLHRLKGSQDSVAQTKLAVELLRDADIKVYASFVLGGPGETRESLENTVAFTKWLIDNKLVDGTEAQPLFPEINARSGKMLLNPEYAQRRAEQEGWKIKDAGFLREMPTKWGNHENPDPEEISRDWASIFSEIPYDELLHTAARIRDYSRKHGVLSGSSWIAKERLK